jgi:hypothetical protein
VPHGEMGGAFSITRNAACSVVSTHFFSSDGDRI